MNSQAAEAEGCCRTWVRAIKPATTLRVMRNTLEFTKYFGATYHEELLRDTE